MNDRAAYANANAALLPLADKSFVREVATIIEGFNLIDHLLPSLDFHRINYELRGLHIAPPSTVDGKHCASFYPVLSVLAFSELKQYLGLPALNSQIWHKGFDKVRSHFVCDLPRVKRLSVRRARLLYSHATAEVMRQKFDGLRRYLLDSNPFTKYRLSGISTNSHSVGATLNCEVTVCVHYPGHVSFISFIHNVTTYRGDVIIPYTPNGAK